MTVEAPSCDSRGYIRLTAKSLIHHISGMDLSDFIDHNYYLKVDVTENTVLEHLSSVIDFSWYPDNYDEFLEQFAENIFPSADTEKIVFSLNRNILLTRYENGEYFFHNEYLLSNPANVTRQFAASCQLCLEEGNVRALILLIDINWLNNSSSIGRAYSEFDWVTGMYQRSYGFRICNEWIRYHSGDLAVVAVLSLNNYEELKKQAGTDAVNNIIRDIHAKLKGAFGNNCIISRFAEDEFCILIMNSTPDHAVDLLDAFISAKLVLPAGDGNITYTVHIGYAVYPQNSPDFAELCCFAEIALQGADSPERSQIVRFSREMLVYDKNRAGFNLKEISDSLPFPFMVCLPVKGGPELLYGNRELIRFFECDSLEDFLHFANRSPEKLFYEEDRVALLALLRRPPEDNDANERTPLRITAKNGVIKDVSVVLKHSDSPYYGMLSYLVFRM
ncbi:MAG: diguanylate cyclase [Lachnospiraceae bacterium]|nr:diguanylate cyclase [Lachnospiraceae bacterium]